MPPVSTLSLEDRIQRIEDQLAIYQIISSYGPAADSCNMADIEKHWDSDCAYVIAGIGTAQGLAALKALFDTPIHQDLLRFGSAHIASLPHVVIEDDQAVATHYAQVFKHEDPAFACARLSIHRWELSRRPEGWKVMRRTTALLNGNPIARALLEHTMKGGALALSPCSGC